MGWKDKVPTSTAIYVQDIVDQIPETMGAREAFVNALDSIAAGGTKPKFRYIIAGDGDVQGTNDLERARHYAVDEDRYVIDSETSKWLVSDDETLDSDITEAR